MCSCIEKNKKILNGGEFYIVDNPFVSSTINDNDDDYNGWAINITLNR